MKDTFVEILAVGGKTNSLGRTEEVIQAVLRDNNLLEELYKCVFNDDAWVRMRAIDAFEKICRKHPDWITQYIDRFQSELSDSNQPSIQWHLAQMYSQVVLAKEQKVKSINWLKNILSSSDIDWIVSANAMKTLVQFAHDGSIDKEDAKALIIIQLKHKSKSVVKKANLFLQELKLD